MRISPALLCLAVLLGAGCNLLELTPTSEVIRERVAGIRAEPAEIGLGETTTLSSLLVRPEEQPEELIGQIWFACVETGGEATGCLGLDLSEAVDDEGGAPDFTGGDFQFGIGDAFTYTAEGDAVEEAWAALEPEDRVEGLTVFVAVTWVPRDNASLQQLLVDLGAAYIQDDEAAIASLSEEFTGLLQDERAETAARRVVISDKSAGAPDPIDCPVETLLPNANPSLVGVRLHQDEDGKDEGHVLGPVTFVAPGERLTLRPVLGEGSVEDYLFIDRNGVTECRREDPFFAWVASGGAEPGSDYTFTAEEGDLEEVAGRAKVNRFALPEAADFPEDGLSLWVVARDRRGGLVWLERRFLPLL